MKKFPNPSEISPEDRQRIFERGLTLDGLAQLGLEDQGNATYKDVVGPAITKDTMRRRDERLHAADIYRHEDYDPNTDPFLLHK